MAAWRPFGTVLYYTGFLVLCLGLLSLAMGLSAIFSSISKQMADVQRGAGLNPGNPDTSSIDPLSEPTDMAVFILDPFVEPFSLLADLWLTEAGFIPLPDAQMQELFYPHFRRFYGLLGLGLFLMLLGTLFKVVDQFASFFGGKRAKLPSNFLRIHGAEEKRMRERARAEG